MVGRDICGLSFCMQEGRVMDCFGGVDKVGSHRGEARRAQWWKERNSAAARGGL